MVKFQTLRNGCSGGWAICTQGSSQDTLKEAISFMAYFNVLQFVNTSYMRMQIIFILMLKIIGEEVVNQVYILFGSKKMRCGNRMMRLAFCVIVNWFSNNFLDKSRKKISADKIHSLYEIPLLLNQGCSFVLWLVGNWCMKQ